MKGRKLTITLLALSIILERPSLGTGLSLLLSMAINKDGKISGFSAAGIEI